MAGTMFINAGTSWLPPGWVYDNILQEIADELSPADANLNNFLRTAKTDAKSVCDLRTLRADEFRRIVDAADRARVLAVSKGAAAFHDQTFAPGYFNHFADLCSLLHADPRANNSTE